MGGEAMASDSDIFEISGPRHITTVHWNNTYHRTVVAACLVKAVSVMQRKGEKLAKPWSEFFGFFLVELLINQADGSIYGAVFEYDNYPKTRSHFGGIPPRCVIAFRGTILETETIFSDLKEDCRCFFNNLNHGRRVKHAIQAIETWLDKHNRETTSVWLAGHSLGAGIALLAGKSMAISGFPLETYAFNPPNSSCLPLEQLSVNEELKERVRIANSYIKAAAALLNGIQFQEDDPRTAAWTPYLYVNPADVICSEYIGEFKHKKIMYKKNASKIERAGARISLRSLLFGRFGKGPSSLPSAEPIQLLLSSGHLTVNIKTAKDAHALKQWWEPDPAWEFHSFRPPIEDEFFLFRTKKKDVIYSH